MMKRIIVLVFIMMMLLPINVSSAEIVHTTMTTSETSSRPTQITLEEYMQMGNGQVLVIPSGIGPDFGDVDIISKNLTGAMWESISILCASFKNKSGLNSDISGALTIKIIVNDSIIAEGIFGVGDNESYLINNRIRINTQTTIAISIDRSVPFPLVPIPASIFVEVNLFVSFNWILSWDIAYRNVTADINQGIDIFEIIAGTNAGTMFIIICASGVICAYIASKRNKE